MTGKGFYIDVFKLKDTLKTSVIVSENVTEMDAVLRAQPPYA